jgi:outer membrane lipoprotein-sorting protein
VPCPPFRPRYNERGEDQLNFSGFWDNSKRKLAAPGLALSLLLSGCIVRHTPVPQNQRLLPAQTRSFSEILQILAERSEAVKSLKAVRVVFRPSAGARKRNEVTEFRDIDGYLLMNRPDNIHIHLNTPLFSTALADMVSDGREYRVWSPLNNNFYVGSADEPIKIGKADLQLPPPKDIARAIFVNISPYLNNPNKYKLLETEAVQGQHSYYVIRVVDVEDNSIEAHALEEIWIDRTNMEIARQVMYGREGVLLTDTDFSGYPSSGEVLIPKVVKIHRPVEDVSLTIQFDRAEPNVVLPVENFQLAQPDGSELILLSGPGAKRQ